MLSNVSELEQRSFVLREAQAWLGTPFHRDQRVKGAGVDCAQLIAAVFESCDVFHAEEWGFFGVDWHLNTDVDHYMRKLIRHASRLPENGIGQPGDVVLARHKCNLTHRPVSFQGGIVMAWPRIIHAHPSRGVCISSAETDPMWMGWDKAFFDPWRKGNDVQAQ